MTGRCWIGVDVGAAKGFDVAAIDQHALVAGPTRLTSVASVVRWLRAQRPRVIAIDSPRCTAQAGQASRPCERELVKAGVCGIRYTPDEAALNRNTSYYAWIANGLRLYAALEETAATGRWEVIECFPTATWSRLGGPREKRPRARWSREVLDGLALRGVPRRMNQDARDAIGAAVTARLHDQGHTEEFGEIAVPLGATG